MKTAHEFLSGLAVADGGFDGYVYRTGHIHKTPCKSLYEATEQAILFSLKSVATMRSGGVKAYGLIGFDDQHGELVREIAANDQRFACREIHSPFSRELGSFPFLRFMVNPTLEATAKMTSDADTVSIAMIGPPAGFVGKDVATWHKSLHGSQA